MAESNYDSVTIADGQSLSGALDVGDYVVCGFVTPSGWTTAALSFQISYDGTTYFNMFNGASELSYAAIAASSWVTIDPAIFMGVHYLKVRSGTSGTPVNQAGGDAVVVITRPI